MTLKSWFWGSVAGYAAVCVVGWFVLPDRVPVHFGGRGAVDRWASHTEAVVTMVAIGGGMALLFWGLASWMPRVSESMLNLNAADKRWWFSTPERETELRRRLAEDLHLFGAATMGLLIAVQVVIITVADDAEPSINPWGWLLLGVYLVGVLGYCAHLALRRYRTPRDVD